MKHHYRTIAGILEFFLGAYFFVVRRPSSRSALGLPASAASTSSSIAACSHRNAGPCQCARSPAGSFARRASSSVERHACQSAITPRHLLAWHRAIFFLVAILAVAVPVALLLPTLLRWR